MNGLIKGIIINPEHGGKDTGLTANDLVEKDLNLLISTYMYNRLCELDIPTKIIRTTDEAIDTKERLNRINECFGPGQDVIVLSNHINIDDNPGTEVIFALRNSDKLAFKIFNNLSQAGETVKKFYQKRLPSDPRKDYNLIIRETPGNQSLSIEYKILSEEDIIRFKNNYKKYAEAIIKALTDFAGLKYKKPLKDNEYLVKKGDTLWTIAGEYNLTANELKALNDLSSNAISINQILKIKSEFNPENIIADDFNDNQ